MRTKLIQILREAGHTNPTIHFVGDEANFVLTDRHEQTKKALTKSGYWFTYGQEGNSFNYTVNLKP